MADPATEKETKEKTETGQRIRKSLLGRKVGMTQIFDSEGTWVPVTVLEVGPCVVLQVKTPEKDGYPAVQIGFGSTKKKPRRPQAGLFNKVGADPLRWIQEIPAIDPADVMDPSEEVKEIKPGQKIGVGAFEGVKQVDVRGVSKGRGFAGTIKRYGFNSGPKSHGTKNIREMGSTGCHTEPGRVFKNRKMPGHMGAVPVKTKNLKVVQIQPKENLLLVRGSVPGHNGGFVLVEESITQPKDKPKEDQDKGSTKKKR